MLSEIVHFPDRTSKEFYATFNQELLLLLGIIPTPALLDRMFTACTYLPWEPFADTVALPQLPLPYGVLSNFHSGLGDLLRQLLPDAQFSHICISENMGVRKPDPEFFRQAAAIIGYAPEEILFVGDSMKLDVTPAQHVGMQARLIDREGFFAASVHQLGGLDALLSEISR
jgi:FMN phosphatase YigB (HAD superfamily)